MWCIFIKFHHYAHILIQVGHHNSLFFFHINDFTIHLWHFNNIHFAKIPKTPKMNHLILQLTYCFNSLWSYWIVVLISYWIAQVSIYYNISYCCVNLSLNWCFNSHIKKINTIQKLHDIDTTNMKKPITCDFPWWMGCNVKGGCLTSVQSDLILDFRHNCINRLVVTALHHCCMKMHGCLIFWVVWCVQSWAWWLALMKLKLWRWQGWGRRGGNGTALENLEGASGGSQRRTRRKDQKSVFGAERIVFGKE